MCSMGPTEQSLMRMDVGVGSVPTIIEQAIMQCIRMQTEQDGLKDTPKEDGKKDTEEQIKQMLEKQEMLFLKDTGRVIYES